MGKTIGDIVLEQIGDEVSDQIGEIILNKITGTKGETISLSLDEMITMLDICFIQPASKEEYKTIWKTIKGSWLTYKKLESKDGNYELSVFTHKHADISHMDKRNYMWIWDKSTDKYYKYSACFWGKLKKGVWEKLQNSTI